MATGTSLSAAFEALRATEEKANFQRLTRLLMRGGLALLKEVFDSIHPPHNLPAVLSNPVIKTQLQTLRRNRVLTHPEWNCLYNPSGPGTYGKSTDFDISLLCKLLRAICSLTPPATGWDILPNSTDHSLEADLARIKFYRNKIYGHNHSMEITNADFEKLWMEISEALLRIASSISSAKRDEWKKSIEKFFLETLTPDAEECVDELRLWHKKDMETKDEIEKLRITQELIQKQLQQMQIERKERNMEILIVLNSLKESGSAVGPSSRMEGDQLPFERPETRIPIPPEQSSAEGTASLSTLTELQASQQNIPVVSCLKDTASSSLVIAGKPVSYLLLDDLAEGLDTNWIDLGKILGFSKKELQRIDKENERLRDKGMAILSGWKMRRGGDATEEVLRNALVELRKIYPLELDSGTNYYDAEL